MLIKDRISTNKNIVNRKSYIMGDNELRNAETYFNKKVKKWCVLFLFDGNIDSSVWGTKGTGIRMYDTEKQAVKVASEYMNRVV